MDSDFIQNINKINKSIAHQQIIHKLAKFALQNDIKDILTPERLSDILSWTDETVAVLKEYRVHINVEN